MEERLLDRLEGGSVNAVVVSVNKQSLQNVFAGSVIMADTQEQSKIP
jgi:hypothetical protein